MKKILFGFSLILVISFAGNSSTVEIDRMIVDIQKPRQSLDIGELEQAKDPFVVAKMDTGTSEIIISKLKKPVPNFSLGAIINNKAHINGDWHKEGETILGYALAHVGTKGVVLTFEKRIVKLFLPERTHKSEGIIKIEEGK